MTTSPAPAIRRAFYFLATLFMTTALLYWGSVILVPLAVASLLAFVLSVPQRWLERHSVPRPLSVPMVSVSTFALLGLLIWIVAGEFRSLAQDLPQYEKTFEQKITPVHEWIQQAEKLQNGPALVAKKVTPEQGQPAPPPPTPVIIQSQGEKFLSWVSGIAGPVLDMAAKTLLVLVLTVFILARRENLSDRFLSLIGPRHLARTTKAMHEASHRVSRFLVLLLFTNTCVGLGVFLGLYLIGIPYPLLWGVLSALLRFLPYVGIWLAAAMPLALSIAIFESWTPLLLALGLYLVLELLMANVIEPLLFGHSTGVSPIALLVAAAFWAWLWGPVGLLLSTPLTVCLVVLGKHAPMLAFLDILLEEAPALAPAARFYQRLLAGDRLLAAQVLQNYLRTRPPHTLYDEVLLPALIRIRRDRQEQQLNDQEEKALLRLFHELLQQVVVQPPPAATAQATSLQTTGASRPHVIACPARGIADELAAEMLRQSLRDAGIDLEVLPFEEALAKVRAAKVEGQPLTLCVIALPPGGRSLCAPFCHKLRSVYPTAHLLAARWGLAADEELEARRLRKAGADEVAVSLLQTRVQIITTQQPLSQAAPA